MEARGGSAGGSICRWWRPETRWRGAAKSWRAAKPAEVSPGEFARWLRRDVEEAGARVAVVDSLSGCMAAMPREEQVLLRLHELLSCLNQRGALTLLISPQSGIDLSHMSDAIPLLRFFEAHGRVRKAPSVIKSRSGGHEDAIRELRTGRSGVRVGEVLMSFRGVMTGTPSCTGDAVPLLEAHVGPDGS